MKILVVNNYDMQQSRLSYLRNESPCHHQFGTDLLLNKGFQVDYELIVPKRYNRKIFRLFSLILPWLKLYSKAKKYDYVYGAADFTVEFLGIAKKLGLFKPRLITIMHHPPFPIRLYFSKYDKVIFLSEFAYNEISNKFNYRKDIFKFLQWGPDLSFYDQIITTPNYLKSHNKVLFVSNGKTHRDHESLVIAAENSKCQTIIVSTKHDIPANFTNECTYADIFLQEYPNDIEMVKLLNKCSVLVIPTYSTAKRLGPIGLTSFLDAIALGMPVITANNTILSEIVTTHKLGFVYVAGDFLDLQKKMRLFKDNPALIEELGQNAYGFRNKCNIHIFSNELFEIFQDLKEFKPL